MLAGREADLESADAPPGYEGHAGATRWLGPIYYSMFRLIAVKAGTHVLDDYQQAIAQARDAVGRVDAGKPVDLASLLPGHIAGIAGDIEPVLGDYLNSPARDWLAHDLPRFVPDPNNRAGITPSQAPVHVAKRAEDIRADSPSRLEQLVLRLKRRASSPAQEPAADLAIETPAAPPVTIGTWLKDGSDWSAQQLSGSARLTRELLVTLATMATAEESVRLNRRVLVLTVIVGILTALTAVTPVSELAIGLLNLIAPGVFPVTSPTPAP